MSASDELRRLLDERGVEWEDFDSEPTWAGGDGRMHYARQEFTFAGLTDEVTVYHLTPEQAIDATLGRGTCRDVGRYSFVCSVCGWASDEPHHVFGGFWPKYCPNCGRAVVE